jgi:hypothetical protein
VPDGWLQRPDPSKRAIEREEATRNKRWGGWEGEYDITTIATYRAHLERINSGA